MMDAQILAALKTRAAQLRVANGYHTDAGVRIFLGRVLDLKHDPLPALVLTQPDIDSDVVEDDESPAVPQMVSEYVAEAYIHVDLADPLAGLMQLREDLLRCLYRPGQQARPGHPRSPDTPDTLGLEGVELRLVSTSKVMPDAGSTVGMVQLTLRAEYIEHIDQQPLPPPPPTPGD